MEMDWQGYLASKGCLPMCAQCGAAIRKLEVLTIKGVVVSLENISVQ